MSAPQLPVSTATAVSSLLDGAAARGLWRVLPAAAAASLQQRAALHGEAGREHEGRRAAGPAGGTAAEGGEGGGGRGREGKEGDGSVLHYMERQAGNMRDGGQRGQLEELLRKVGREGEGGRGREGEGVGGRGKEGEGGGGRGREGDGGRGREREGGDARCATWRGRQGT